MIRIERALNALLLECARTVYHGAPFHFAKERGDGHFRPAARERRAADGGSLRERLLARAERVGYAEAHGVRVEVRSVHELAGSRFKSAEPVGYLFELDGRAIGAIELTDIDPMVFLPPSDSPELRTVSLIAALALSAFRDPAESALDD